MSEGLKFWEREAKSLTRQINLGWWLDALVLPWLLIGLCTAISILLLRIFHPDLEPTFPALLIGFGALSAGIFALLWSRKRFQTTHQSFVRLESKLGLNNSLTAARLGHCDWPAPIPQESLKKFITWQWWRFITPIFIVAGLLAAAFWMPTRYFHQQSLPPQEPPAWEELAAQIEQLEEDKTVSEDYLEELEERLQELRNQKREDWFKHSSMEATDYLERNHRKELTELEKNMRRMERGINALQNHSNQMSSDTKKRLQQELRETFDQMKSNQMKPNQELMDSLQKMDLQELGDLSEEEINQIRKSLKERAEELRQQQGGKGAEQQTQEWIENQLNQQNTPSGQGGNPGGQQSPDGEGNQPGTGGVQRGPGTSPGVLGPDGKPLSLGDLERLQSRDPKNLTPGDLLNVTEGEHQIDQTTVAPREGGGIQHQGQGGRILWEENLTPNERKVLQEFYQSQP